MILSSLISRFSESETLRVAQLANKLKAEGADIIDLGHGEPDFNTPMHIQHAAKNAIDENWSHYTPVAGYRDLREAVCQKFQRDNDLTYQPNNILISTGAKQSLTNVILALIDKGDEVIIPAPYWATYKELVKIAGGVPVIVNTKVQDNYKLTAKQLSNAITSKTKMFLFSSPCNPTGAVYTHKELASLKNVLLQHPSIAVVSDEIYEYINFNGSHQSIAQFKSINERVVVINGLSKGFAMTGWRLGYMAASVDIIKACEKLQGQFTSGTNSITQRAAITALLSDLGQTKEMTREFKRRRDMALEIVDSIPGMSCVPPDGTFYILADVSWYFGKKIGDKCIRNADDVCIYLLHSAHVSTVSGCSFGANHAIRITFANTYDNIEMGYRRIKDALSQLKE